MHSSEFIFQIISSIHAHTLKYFNFTLFVCIGVLISCMSMRQCWIPGTRVTDDCELPCGWVLEIKPRFFWRAVSVLHHWSICPASSYLYLVRIHLSKHSWSYVSLGRSSLLQDEFVSRYSRKPNITGDFWHIWRKLSLWCKWI